MNRQSVPPPAGEASPRPLDPLGEPRGIAAEVHGHAPHLLRRFGLVQATALNMSNMVGAGPFITIPLLLSTMMGPQAILGWAVAFLITINDAMVWSELGAALPGSGGSYVYLRDGFGRHALGRLMAFLFIWQFILSGPLEIASAYIGFAKYLGYIWHQIGENRGLSITIAAAIGGLNIVLLYRKITSIGRLTVTLWIGMLITLLAVVLTGAMHFDAQRAFSFPPKAFQFSLGFLLGLGRASAISLYDYLGYYDVCYIGDEVREPGRVIPRSILLSLVIVGVIYFAINLSVIGVVPWQEFITTDAAPNPNADYMISILMERVYGSRVATLFTVMILWTTLAGTFALLLGYSRIPYAAAQDGYFFSIFSRLHPTKHFPHVSLLTIGLLSIACCALSLDTVISALLLTRIVVLFGGQIFAIFRLRRVAPEMPRPYRIWLYPLTPLVALAGWAFVFAASEPWLQFYATLFLAAGVIAYFIRAATTRQWPFAAPLAAGPPPAL